MCESVQRWGQAYWIIVPVLEPAASTTFSGLYGLRLCFSAGTLNSGKTQTEFVGPFHDKPRPPPPIALSTPDTYLSLAAQSSHSVPFPSQVSRATPPSLLFQLSLRPHTSPGPSRQRQNFCPHLQCQAPYSPSSSHDLSKTQI